jgi:hypothetical protein
METVLYTENLEPVTIIDIPMKLWIMLNKGETVGLAVPYQFKLEKPTDVCDIYEEIVYLHAEPICRRSMRSIIVFVDNEVIALALKSSLLPGQRKDVQYAMSQAKRAGFLEALKRFG